MKKHATKIFLLAAFTGAFCSQVNAQSKAKPNAVGLNVGVVEYAGDVTHNFYKFKNLSPSLGLSFEHYLNKSFNTSFSFSAGKFGGEDATKPINEFETKFFDFAGNIMYKFDNGYLLKETSKFAPFVWGGIGFLDYKAENKSGLLNNPGDVLPDNTKEAAFRMQLGYGVAYKVDENWSVRFQSSWAKVASDEIDNWNITKDPDHNDRLLHHQIGVAYSFGLKDSDNDGVADKYDRCPDLAGSEETFGCPDQDNDGVLDAEDKCPTVKGIVFGCPDSDGDGFIDSEDKCPDVAGSLYGCLDTDKDGVADADDACPELKGCINGCPDSDGDGVVDTQDECPDVFGSKDNKGCPNIVEDDEIIVTDKMVATPSGTRVEREKAHQSTTIYMVFFDYNSSVLNPDLQTEVEDIAEVLIKNKEYYVILEGHTDSKGTDKYNEWLSGRRVDKVADYLIGKGINKERILFVKYGETQPLLPNDTATGMEKNRRVVMKVVKN